MEHLATELLAQIFHSCTSINDVLSLALTSRHLHSIYTTRKLTILTHAAEAQYGPLHDAIQLITHNASQPAHIPRSPPISLALLQQIASVGRVASAWADVYPFKKWRGDDNFVNRRLLMPDERRLLRRAVYRVWLYARAFHNPAHSRFHRLTKAVVLERAELLHNWTNSELAEIADVRQVMREVVGNNVCPSNGAVMRKFKKRFPDTNHQLMFNVHLNYPPPMTQARRELQQRQMREEYFQHLPQGGLPTFDKYYAKYRPTPMYEPGGEGWGDDIEHYYVVEDMMKLDPSQILWLRNNCTSKAQVESYVKSLGDWFLNNGETFGQTLEFVLSERGEEVDVFMDEVEEGDKGIACS